MTSFNRANSMPPGLAGRLNPLCDRFEHLWLRGASPRLEEFLQQAAESDRSALLRELIELELYYRTRRGELATAEEYRQRLPEYADLVDAIFSSLDVVANEKGQPNSDDKLGGNALQSSASASINSDADETVNIPPTEGTPSSPSFAPPVEPEEVGKLGPYRIVKQLGQGGMGAVYLAFDTRLGRKLALKVMLPRFAADASAKERFLREARAAAQISHDNVVTVYEADERDGIPFIAMQFLQGYPLDQYLRKKGNPSISQILRIARETALGLAAAHHMGCVHRDIKPANLWLEAPNGRVKILDFGLARPVDTEAELTKSGAVVGTPAYMSPEQGRGLKVDHRTDLFSLGIVLYRLSTGKLPFNGPTTMAVLMALGMEEPSPVRELNQEVPDALAALIHQLLAKNPYDRPQTADEVAKRVGAIAEELATPLAQAVELASQPQVIYVPIEITAQPQSSPFSDLDVTAAEQPSLVVTDAAPKPVRKNAGGKGVWIAAGFAALLASAVLAGAFIFKNKPEPKLEVSDDPILPPKPLVKPSSDPDRKAAEYVLSIGGSVEVNGEERQITAMVDLPKDRFSLTGVDLSRYKNVSDIGLANFKDCCKNLIHLDLNFTLLTDAGLANFKDCKNLTVLRLRSQLTDVGLANFKDCKNLTVLCLLGPVTDAGLSYFKDCNALWYLLLYSEQLTDVGLAYFKNANNLTDLRLGGKQLTDVGLAYFKDKNLRYLDVQGTSVTDAGLEYFKDCKYLSCLQVGVKTTDTGLAHFKDCKNLATIDLRNAKITDFGLANFNDCNKLLNLLLDNTQVTDVGLENFKDCKALSSLSLEHTQVTDTGLAYFKDCKDLSDINLRDTPLTNVGLVNFKESVSLTSLRLGNNMQLTDAGLANLKDCKSLTYLDVRKTKVSPKVIEQFSKAQPQCKIEYDGGIIEPTDVIDHDRKAAEYVLSIGGRVKVSGEGREIKAVADLPKDHFRYTLTDVELLNNKLMTDAGLTNLKDCKNLRSINLCNSCVTDAGLTNFKDCKNLTDLRLDGTHVTNVGLENFKNCKNLSFLDLAHTPLITDAGLENFKDCKNLLHLHLGETQVTDVGLANFKDCKNLITLGLSIKAVTDVGLTYFKDCKNLTSLHLRYSQVSNAGLANFKDCKNLWEVYLFDTQVSDAGLANFKDCKNLAYLDVRKTKVSPKFIEEFSKAHPQCKIDHDDGGIQTK